MRKVTNLAFELNKRTEESSTINVSLGNASYRIEEVKKLATNLETKAE